jgi:serine/threonine protein kinase
MAEVYKGYHPRLDRTVAIKILPPAIAAEADFRQRFEREARAVAALKHPNIVQVFDFGDVEGLYYMVMEYIAGKDLAHLMQENGPLPPTQTLPFLRDVAGALDYAHSQGLVHRDIKPSNVMLEPVGQVANLSHHPPTGHRAILTDFGIVRLLDGGGGMTKSAIIGTLDYMAPEQIRASGEVDGRADVYALGVMAYQMLTGQLPFAGGHIGAMLMAHLQQPPRDPRELLPHLSAGAAKVLLQALAKEPEERFSTAGAFVAALTEVL